MLRPARLRILLLVAVLLLLPRPVEATWSIIAVDTRSGIVVIASATCVSAEGLRTRGGLKSIQAVIVPGIGVAAAQAGVDGTRANQTLIFQQLQAGADPDEIIRMLSEDENFQRRQFGIVDLQGRSAGFSGTGNGFASLAVQSDVREAGIYFAVQGNILESDDVVLDAVAAFLGEDGTVWTGSWPAWRPPTGPGAMRAALAALSPCRRRTRTAATARPTWRTWPRPRRKIPSDRATPTVSTPCSSMWTTRTSSPTRAPTPSKRSGCVTTRGRTAVAQRLWGSEAGRPWSVGREARQGQGGGPDP